MYDPERLMKQLGFIREIDKLKKITRQTLLMDGSRYENDAEHSWHLCAMVLVLSEYSNVPIDVPRVLAMLLIHDLVEVYAGDTFCYDVAGNRDKAQREAAAAEKLFGLLPADQRDRLESSWKEFEERQSPESKFAAALDRLQPIMHNFATAGAAWKKHGVTRSMVDERNAHIKDGSEVLWAEFKRIADEAVEKGYLAED